MNGMGTEWFMFCQVASGMFLHQVEHGVLGKPVACDDAVFSSWAPIMQRSLQLWLMEGVVCCWL